jgi:ornithine cyclodeaminase
LTICDLSGTGVQDTAIANLALQQAAKKGIGIEIEIKRG